MPPSYLHVGGLPFEPPIREDNLHLEKMKKPKTKKAKKAQLAQPPRRLQQPPLTNEQWAAEVQEFRTTVQGDHTDTIVTAAWKSLRQAYSNKFSAVISSTTPLETLEPFPFWASENLETEVLERVLRVEFAKHLSTANYLPSINSSAAQAKISIWHLVLFFGESLFSETRLFLLKKRLRVFVIDPEDGTWPFTQAYKSMLRHAVVASTVPEIDTSSIPCAGGQVLFKTPQISGLATANPEFERQPQKRDVKSKHANGFGMTGIPLSKRNATRASVTLGQSLRHMEDQTQGDKTVGQSERGHSLEQQQDDRSYCIQKMLVPGEKTDIQASPERSSTYGEDRGKRLPPLRHSTTERSNSWAVDSDLALLSIEGTAESEERTTKSLATLSSFKRVGGSATPHSGGPRMAETQARAKTIKPSSGHFSEMPYFEPDMSVTKSTSITAEERFVKAESVESASPFSTHRNASSASRKRSIEDLGEIDNPSSKRVDTSSNHAHLTERAQDWDDETILGILKQLEATRPNDFIVIDGMKTCGNQDLPRQIFEADEDKGTILLPLKVDDGHRLLVVISVKPITTISENTKEGVIQYYDPMGGAESDGHYEPISLVAQLISFILPNRDPDPSAWHVQHCVCPDQLAEGNSGVCLCLAAICVVGSLPLAPPLPEEVDWMFWRSTILSIFLPEDTSVQIRTKHYRAETIERLVRQGRVRGLTPAEPSADDVQYLGHTVRDADDRIQHRAANMKALVEMVHQGLRIFHNLQEQIDLSHASFRAELDKSLLSREVKCQSLIIKAEPPQQKLSSGAHQKEHLLSEGGCLRQADDPIQLFNTSSHNLGVARQHVRKAMRELNEWRSLINFAVEEYDENVRHAMTD